MKISTPAVDIFMASCDVFPSTPHLPQKISLPEVIFVPNFEGEIAFRGIFEANRDDEPFFWVGPNGLQRQRDCPSAPKLQDVEGNDRLLGTSIWLVGGLVG